ncbi:MAG: ATP-binding protein [Candidatus Paceibacterota bacterium]
MKKNPENVNKFALIGAQSVGKTTMLNILRDRLASSLPNVVFIDEGARLFFDSNPQITSRSADVQEQIQNFVLEREKLLCEPDTKLIISDRSVIDPVVLTKIWDTEENATKLHSNVADWLITYTLFFLLSPEGVPSVAEPNRKETDEERIAIHDTFISYCTSNNLPYVEIIGSLDERTKQIEEIILQSIKDAAILS